MSVAGPEAPPHVDPSPHRWRRALFTPTLLRVLGLLALAVGIFAAYVVTWVFSRDAYFTTRNFRILAGLGKQVESIIAVQKEGLRYGALGEEVEEPVRQETELSISYPATEESREAAGSACRAASPRRPSRLSRTVTAAGLCWASRPTPKAPTSRPRASRTPAS